MPTASTPTILLLYSSRFGHCQRVATRLSEHLQALGHNCLIQNLETMPQNEASYAQEHLGKYAAIVVVASIRYGFFHSKVGQFVQNNLSTLRNTLDVFVPITLIARKPEKRSVATNVYARKFLAKTGWNPKIISFIAGELLYPTYNFFDRFMIKLIMRMSKGDLDTSRSYDYTNWDDVAALASQMNEQLKSRTVAPSA